MYHGDSDVYTLHHLVVVSFQLFFWGGGNLEGGYQSLSWDSDVYTLHHIVVVGFQVCLFQGWGEISEFTLSLDSANNLSNAVG